MSDLLKARGLRYSRPSTCFGVLNLSKFFICSFGPLSARRSSRRLASFLSLALFLLSVTSLTVAQSSRGTVSGLVVDATKAAVFGAAVDLTNEDTKVVRSTTTNESGAY